ncbi:molecular chaperone [Eggerthella sinensis]|uniref:TorD/DmsD family molecular chaperone n=1 Tax=Eggerthella sinensis TaxID=242230 RepID=UPI00248D9C0A|nr:molecular chaperone TorD family protein [Eggerthella sinensis]
MESQTVEETFALGDEQVEKLEAFCAVDELAARLFEKTLDDDAAAHIAQLGCDAEDDFILSSEAAREGLSRMVAFCSEASPETMARAKADFHKLFVGPQKLPSPPWGSVYLDRRGMLFGPSEQKVQDFMERFGLRKASEEHAPCDHFAIELQFVAELGKRAVAALPEDGQAARRDLAGATEFMDAYVATWHGRFLGLVEHHAETAFYQGLAMFARGVIEQQLAWLRDVAA